LLNDEIRNWTITEGVVGLQVFTGVDSTSAFVGKGKKKAFALFEKHPEFQQAFQCLGVEFCISAALVSSLERFVCKLYGQSCDDINEARYRLFCTKALSEIRLPPCRNAFVQHCKRANYQTAIWRRALQNNIRAPNPNDCGWVVNSCNQVSIRWMTQEQAPLELMQNYACKCKIARCSSNQCSCFANKVSCTELCACVNCTNEDETIIEIQLLHDESDDEEND